MKLFWIILTCCALGLAGGFLWWNFKGKNVPVVNKSDPIQSQNPSKTVLITHPKSHEDTTISVRQLCILQPYFRAELSTRLLGTIKTVTKNIGDQVREGELLLELDVPDVVGELKVKEEMVSQKRADLAFAMASVTRIGAGIEAAQGKIDQSKAALLQAIALMDLRKKKLDRYKTLAKDDNVSGDLVDEQIKEYDGSVAGVELAKASVVQAHGALEEKKAEIAAAQADTEQKKSAIRVAQTEVEKVKAQLELARVLAPFDGAIVRRSVDPGDFSFSPSGNSKEAMLVVASKQLAKVTARFSDSVLVGLSGKTIVEISFDQVPGVILRGQVSRYSPMVDSGDRSVLVELDLDLRPISAVPPIPGAIRVDPSVAPRLVLGITGTMKLKLENLGNAALVPSGAIFSKGGKPHLFLVEKNKAILYPATILLDDGNRAVVQIPFRGAKPGPTRHLKPEDSVVLNRQTELEDGMTVTTSKAKP